MSTSKAVIPMSSNAPEITQDDIAPTILPDAYLQSNLAQSLASFHMPRYQDLPSVELYRDQVIGTVEQVLQPLDDCADGDWLTPSMVNNYVKLGLIAPPHKKLYGREQIARLIVICVFKHVLSIHAISSLFHIQRVTYTAETAYDYVARELEGAVRGAFSNEASPAPDSASLVTRESLLVRNAVITFSAKAYLMGYLKYIGYDEHDGGDHRKG